MSKLIQLEEAATMLGISVEDLNELRSRGDIHAYRDGKTWKFKEAEIERYKSMNQDIDVGAGESGLMSGSSALLSGSSAEVDADLEQLVDVGDIGADDLEVIDDADVGEPNSASSTIIGKPKLDDVSLGGDDAVISLDADDDALVGGASDLKLVESGINLDADAGSIDIAENEDLDLVEGSELNLAASSDILMEGDATDDDAAATGVLSGGDDLSLDAEPEISLDDALSLSDEDLEISLESSSEINLDGSDLDLAPSDTGVGVADGGSDITINAGDSGINLGAPSDSGISLDQTPPEIAVADEAALELGEADLVDLGDSLMDDDFQADDDFNLSPSESDLGEEDSGSQVIALDTEELDEDAATLLGADDGEQFETYEADADEMAPLAAAVGAEAPYSLFVVLALGTIMTMLGLTGVMLVDLVHNMWSWDGTNPASKGLMDAIIGMFGG